MSLPVNRDQFKKWCLRDLGAPVLQINLSEDQIDDAVDYCLQYYADYHFDGTEAVYYKHQVTPTDVTNKYITLPDNIIGAVEIFNIADPSIRADDIFNIRYQIAALNDLYTLTSVSIVPYYMTMQHLATMTEFLVGKQPIRYNRKTNICHLDTDWNSIPANTFLLVRAYQVVSPDEYPKVWGDRWLLRYCTAHLKRRWGNVLSKFNNVQVAGGLTLNGEKILSDAVAEIADLEHDMINSYSLPNLDLIG